MATASAAAAGLKGESAEWLNSMVAQLWPYIDEFSKTIMKETIEPMLNEKVPGAVKPITFKKMSLGCTPLTIDKVIVHETQANSLLLDMDIDFMGDPEISLSLVGGTITGGIEKLHISGRLCVLLKPLISTVPLVGAVQAAFLNTPDLSLDFSGIAELGDFGIIKRAIEDTVMSVMTGVVVYPNTILVKLSDSVDYFDCFHPPVGLLRMGVAEARGLKSSGFAFLKDIPDPYVKVTLGGEVMKTETVKDSENPKFSTTYDFLLSDSRQELHVGIYDSDVLRDDKHGEARLAVADVLAKGELWTPTKTTDGKDGPEVKLTATVLPLVADASLQEKARQGANNVLVAVLIDKAVGLKKESAPKVQVTLGKETQETGEFAEGKNVDTTLPVYNTAKLFLLESIADLSVSLTVISGSTKLGHVTIPLSACLASQTLSTSDSYVLTDSPVQGATLRAMIRLFYIQQ